MNPHYITYEELSALVPDGWLAEGLSDDDNADAEKFDVVRDAAEREANGILKAKFAVPFDRDLDTFPEVVSTATLYIAAKLVYGRRGFGDKYPYETELKDNRSALRKLGTGGQSASPDVQPRRGSVVVIMDDAKTYSGSLNN